MTNLLLRLFLRVGSEKDPLDHASVGKFAGITGIVCNMLLAAMKLAVGILTGSVAVLGDGINNLTDCVSSVVTFLGFRLAQRPADREHPFGHGRYEYVSGLAVAGLVLLAGAELAKSSVEKILNPEPVPFSWVMLAVLLVSILAKLWLAGFDRNLAKRIHSRTLEAASRDSRNDVVATSAVVLCILADVLFGIHLDGIAGLGVAAFVLWSGIGLARDTVSPLLGMQADQELVEELTALVLAHRRVQGIHDLMIHDYGPGRCFATVHAEMDASESPLDAHDQLDHIEQEALRRLGVHLVIHYDPVAKDESWDVFRAMAEACAADIIPEGNIHDLRVVCYHERRRLTFDLTVPFDFPMPDDVLVQEFIAALSRKGCTIPTEIHIDRQA